MNVNPKIRNEEEFHLYLVFKALQQITEQYVGQLDSLIDTDDKFFRNICKMSRFLNKYESKAPAFLPFSVALEPLVAFVEERENDTEETLQVRGSVGIESVGSLLDSADQ